MVLSLLMIACQAPPEAVSGPTHADPTPDSPEPAREWTIAIWLDGDNNLETYVPHDMDELERAAYGPATIVAQIDRIPGYMDEEGAWDGTRRYEFVADDQHGPVSPMIEDVGEVDMGDPAALSEFLLWTHEHYPAQHYALVFWNHGGGFWIASDDTDGGRIDVTNGELESALRPLVDLRGPIDVVGFDACNMGQWEVAEALRGEALTMVASQAWVDGGGYAYDAAFPAIKPGDGPAVIADLLAWSAGEINGELTQSAIDLVALEGASLAIDALAQATSADTFARGRAQAHSTDLVWDDFWIDAGSLAGRIADFGDPGSEEAAAMRDALDASVIATYNSPELAFATGLTVFGDTEHASWVERYAQGPWGWTGWDELLAEAHDAGL